MKGVVFECKAHEEVTYQCRKSKNVVLFGRTKLFKRTLKIISLIGLIETHQIDSLDKIEQYSKCIDIC